MKIFIRGGVWSNVEDQVLLAAYMKYGGNQWLRIASLLPRKTASQVKARWEEYLDPTLRKTPWTQHEDEKLLHLARLMPMQWRTISQYFGRSAYQCVERYKELVDKASATPHYDDNDAAVSHEMMPNFETLNPVPDPVELDQDEKEMLAEARARLANTQGKKARRKARERQLDVMRKIVKLRKKRELVAAGIILEEKNMWEDKEFEVDVLTTHEAKKVKFDTEEDDAIAKQERINRIKKKVEERKKSKENKKTEESPDLLKDLGHYKEELAKEEAKLDVHYEIKQKDLILPTPQISDSELKSVEAHRHNNIDFFEQKRSLSLFGTEEIIEETWNGDQIIESEPFKSSVVEHEIVRPKTVSLSSLFTDDYDSKNITCEDIADQLIKEEAIRLACRDARYFSQAKSKSDTEYKNFLYPDSDNEIAYFSDFQERLDLTRAQIEIDNEISGKALSKDDINSFIECWDEMHKDDNEQSELLDLDILIKKQERKVARLRDFYLQKTKNANLSCQNLLTKLNQKIFDLYKLANDKERYINLQQAEEKMIEVRIGNLTEKILKLQAEQTEVDNEYKRVLLEKKEAARKLRK